MAANKEILMKFISNQGYKRNSPDVNNPFNIIPSGRITMKDVDFPVKGVDNLGNEIIMQPGEEYQFPGNYVVETRHAQNGGNVSSAIQLALMLKDQAHSYQEGGYTYEEPYHKRETKRAVKSMDSFTNGLIDGMSNSVDNIVSTALKVIDPITPNSVKKAVNENIFEHIRPVKYPGFIQGPYDYFRSDRPKPGRDAEGDYEIPEEAWRKALQLPTKSKYIVDSKYRPSTSKNPNAKYYTLNNVIDQNKIIEYVKSQKGKKGDSYQMDSLAPYMRNNVNMRGGNENLDPLQKFQISVGEDEKGKYAAIYDKFDFHLKTANHFIKPYEFYDRYYYKQRGGVTYGTPEYEKAYNRGEVITKEGVHSPILLNEVVVKNNYKRPRNFLEQYADKIVEENKDAGPLGAIIGTPISAVTSVPQLMGMKALTGKMERPSEAMNIQNPYGAAAVDFLTDPATYFTGDISGLNKLTKEQILEKAYTTKFIPKPRRRILPDDLSYRVVQKDGITGVDIIDKNKNVYAYMDAQPQVSMYDEDLDQFVRNDNPEWFAPEMINVNDELRGKKLQDVLYQLQIDQAQGRGYKGVRSGDLLVQPQNTVKAYDNFDREIFFKKISKGMEHDVVGLRGHKNPNVVNDWFENYKNIDKFSPKGKLSFEDIAKNALSKLKKKQ